MRRCPGAQERPGAPARRIPRLAEQHDHLDRCLARELGVAGMPDEALHPGCGIGRGQALGWRVGACMGSARRDWTRLGCVAPPFGLAPDREDPRVPRRPEPACAPTAFQLDHVRRRSDRWRGAHRGTRFPTEPRCGMSPDTCWAAASGGGVVDGGSIARFCIATRTCAPRSRSRMTPSALSTIWSDWRSGYRRRVA
jgi:hypothetical protein